MKAGIIRNKRSGQIVGNWVWKADSFWTRFKGLLGRTSLEPGEGLWLQPCQQVHMLGMKFSLSVWFIDQTGHVCELLDELKPWSVSPKVRKAVSILEFPKGWGKETETELGDELIWEEHL